MRRRRSDDDNRIVLPTSRLASQEEARSCNLNWCDCPIRLSRHIDGLHVSLRGASQSTGQSDLDKPNQPEHRVPSSLWRDNYSQPDPPWPKRVGTHPPLPRRFTVDLDYSSRSGDEFAQF